MQVLRISAIHQPRIMIRVVRAQSSTVFDFFCSRFPEQTRKILLDFRINALSAKPRADQPATYRVTRVPRDLLCMNSFRNREGSGTRPWARNLHFKVTAALSGSSRRRPAALSTSFTPSGSNRVPVGGCTWTGRFVSKTAARRSANRPQRCDARGGKTFETLLSFGNGRMLTGSIAKNRPWKR